MTQRFEATPIAAFNDELRQSLPRILAALDALALSRLDRAAAGEAHRLIHALKGAASMVGLAALGHLLHAAEELIERSPGRQEPLTDETLATLRDALPRFGIYLEAALAGQPIEPLALSLARILGLGGPEETAALSGLLEIETREMAWAPAEPAESPALDPEPPAEVSLLSAIIDARDDETRRVGRMVPAPEPVTPAPAVDLTVPAASSEADVDVSPPAEIPPQLAEIFGLEAQEHLETIARVTSALSPASDDRNAIQELRRAVHTLKGAAGMVGFRGAARLAHRMEDVLDRLFEGTAALTAPTVRTLAASSDALHDLIAGTPDLPALRAVVGRLFADYDVLVGDGAAATSSEPGTGPAEADFGRDGGSREPGTGSQYVGMVSPMLPAAEAAPSPAVPGEHQGAGEPEPIAERVGERRRRMADRRGGQFVRVPLARLNELVRIASELLINRSTFEQHHLALIEQVEELELSTARLRRVAHRLEADYEVRALGGRTKRLASIAERAGGSPSAQGFDELEFDRYTEFHLLTRELTETTSDIATVGARVAGTIRDFDADLTRLGRLTRDVQDKTMEFRMVPLGTLTTQLERAVRSTAEACGKPVDFRIEGEQVALDKSLLEQMADPLLHLLRNAVDHGIEDAERRRAAGKPERGTVTVRAFHEGTDVLIEVEDDGSGLDLERIRRTAIARGYTSETSTMGADALFALIFEPGFSTADRVSEISGRGVGMDVVKSRVAQLRGRIHVASRPGAGTTMSVRVPMTLAMTRILLVRSGGETFGLPLSAVVQIVRPHPTSISTVGGERVFTVDGRTYPLRDLADALGLPRAADAPAVPPVLIANLSRRRIALQVDGILNSRDAVVKTLGTHLRRVHGVWGATLLGDGTVVLILNPADLANAADEPAVAPRPAAGALGRQEPYQVLIVDDSLSMRHMLSLAVKKAGWVPVPARDGLDALEIIHRGPRMPDLVLLDVEMPRMDGYEFLSTMRSQKAHAGLPIVMLTSRGSAKHRDQATALGATEYMVKPFQEEALIRTIARLVAASRRLEKSA